jgi:putative DNA primase/helicase
VTIDTQALKDRADIVSVVSAYTRLKKMGVEYCGPCPIHGGDGDNFYVNPRKGIWRCFSRGCDECDEGNDVIGFLRRVENITFQEACEKLGAGEWKPKAPIKEKAKPPPERVASTPPADAGEPDMALRDLGAPARVWIYRDVGGAPLMYVARYDTKDGKEIRCFSWGGRPGDAPAWHCMHFNRGQRPLYNLDQITAKPLAPVLMVEGEKAADAAAAILPQYVVTTWPGGAQAWKLADLSPLKGRRVDLWPDADKPGREAMERLAAILADPRGLGCSGKIVDTAELAEGFDAADWQGDDIIGWLRPRAKPYGAATEPKHEPAAPAEPPPPPPPEEPEDAGELPAEMSEDFLAERFAELHGGTWRYVKPWGSWFEWRKDGWYRDDKALIDRLAVELTRKALYWPEAKQLSQDAKRRINSRRTAGAVRDTAMSHRRIAASTEQWDCDPWLLGVPGGVVNLKNGELKDAKPGDYMTKRCAVPPERGAPKLWIEFLQRVTDGDGDLVAYLQRFAGYALTGTTSEHALSFLYGTGANGKTTFLQTLTGIWGDYAVSAGFEVFADSKAERHPTEIARLRGARLVVTEETDAGGRWNEGRVKRLTGGGKISAHFMRQDDFEFEPQFKLLIAGNHKPVIRAVDEAIKRRIHLVPFTVTIPPQERDKQLMAKLEDEWPQILHWAIEGCIAWQEYSLSPGERIIAATEQYVESEDILGAWLEECCERSGDWDGKSLFDNYRKWCEAQGEHAWSRRAWSNAMLDRGFPQKRTSTSRRFHGVSLKLGQQQGYDVP